jgi:hypothetical protein
VSTSCWMAFKNGRWLTAVLSFILVFSAPGYPGAVEASRRGRAPFDLSQSELLPDQRKPAWRSLIEQLGNLAERIACRHDAVLIDFRTHPVAADVSIYSTDRIHLAGN